MKSERGGKNQTGCLKLKRKNKHDGTPTNAEKNNPERQITDKKDRGFER